MVSVWGWNNKTEPDEVQDKTAFAGPMLMLDAVSSTVCGSVHVNVTYVISFHELYARHPTKLKMLQLSRHRDVIAAVCCRSCSLPVPTCCTTASMLLQLL